MGRRKRKQHPATTRIFAPPATRFEIKLQQIKLAWRSMYNEVFPSDIVGLVDMLTYTLPPVPHKIAAANANGNATSVLAATAITYNPATHNVYENNNYRVISNIQYKKK